MKSVKIIDGRKDSFAVWRKYFVRNVAVAEDGEVAFNVRDRARLSPLAEPFSRRQVPSSIRFEQITT